MRVALDLAHLRQGRAGVARVSLALRDALRARGDVEVVSLGDGPALPRGALRRRGLALAQDLAWYPLGTRRAARRAGADVHHCPLPRAPLARGRPPLVVTVHDLAVLRFPETLSGWNRRYSRATFARVLEAADRVVCVSHDTARDCAELAGVAAERLRVVPNGVAARFGAEAPRTAEITGDYVLFVGTPEPRKNLGRLVEATGRLGIPLVVAGGGGWGGEVPGGDARVTTLGFVEDDDRLLALYAHAACLAIPSLHEGFGLPALEAMASGCPVVAARAGALPEVCGEAAVLVEPTSVDSIAGGIAEALARGEELRQAGRARAAQFTWTSAAERLVEVYRELV
jgi:glycosyltransferase involved in cell wall biosynthesis